MSKPHLQPGTTHLDADSMRQLERYFSFDMKARFGSNSTGIAYYWRKNASLAAGFFFLAMIIPIWIVETRKGTDLYAIPKIFAVCSVITALFFINNARIRLFLIIANGRVFVRRQGTLFGRSFVFEQAAIQSIRLEYNEVRRSGDRYEFFLRLVSGKRHTLLSFYRSNPNLEDFFLLAAETIGLPLEGNLPFICSV